MSHTVMIPHGMRCHDSGSVVVSSASIGLPASIWEKATGKDLMVTLDIETDQIRMEFDGSAATSSDVLREVGDHITINSIADVKRCRMIRVTADATVRFQAFSRPI